MTITFHEWLVSNGYEVTYGEVKRTPAQATVNVEQHIGIQHSLHLISLAEDLNIFKDGKLMTGAEGDATWEPIGKQWESLGGSWGGRFSNRDYNHFSLSYQGVR